MKVFRKVFVVIAVVVIAVLALRWRKSHRRRNAHHVDWGTGTFTRTSTARQRSVTVGGTAVRVEVSEGHAQLVGNVRDGSAGVVGVRVEAVDSSPAQATTSGPDGLFRLTVPSNVPTYFRASKSGYRAAQAGVTVSAAGLERFPLELVSEDVVARVFRGANVTEDAAAGLVAVRFELHADPPLQDERPAGFGATLASGGGIPFSFAHDQVRQSATTIGGEELVVFVNVAVGPTAVTASGPAGWACVPSRGAPSTVRVDPGIVTYVSFDCTRGLDAR